MDDMVAAFAERQLEQFVLIPSNPRQTTTKINPIWGEISSISKEQKSVRIRIPFARNGEAVLRLLNEPHNLSFQVNRMPYQLQHQALDFIQKEKLFNVLINNDNYRRNFNGVNASQIGNNHEFKYDISYSVSFRRFP